MKIHIVSGRADGKGAFSKYYIKSPRVGLKVIVACGSFGIYGRAHPKIDSTKLLCKSHLWRSAKEEFKLLTKAYNKCSLFPKPYELCVAKIGKYVYPAIKMEHINGPSLYKAKGIKSYQKDDLVEDLEDYLRTLGIYHDDLHDNNIIVASQRNFKVKLRPIDCSPEFISLTLVTKGGKKKLKLWI